MRQQEQNRSCDRVSFGPEAPSDPWDSGRAERLANARRRMKEVMPEPRMAAMLAQAIEAMEQNPGLEEESVGVEVRDEDRALTDRLRARYLALRPDAGSLDPKATEDSSESPD